MEWIPIALSAVSFIIGKLFGGKKTKKYLSIAQQATDLVQYLITAIEDDKVTEEELARLKEKIKEIKAIIKES
jgi:hypothetical protein